MFLNFMLQERKFLFQLVMSVWSHFSFAKAALQPLPSRWCSVEAEVYILLSQRLLKFPTEAKQLCPEGFLHRKSDVHKAGRAALESH